MADPLSMAASLIAVVQVSAGIISLCYDYRRAVQGAKKEVATLQREVQSLRDVIEQILKLLDTEDDDYLPVLKKMNARNNAFSEYEEQFRDLEDRLRTPVSRWRQLGHQLLWPLRERDLAKDLQTIHRMKGVLEFGLVTDSAFSIMEIRKDTRDLKERVVSLASRRDVPKEQKLQVMLEWLGAPDPSSRHNELRRKRAKDTGLWLLNSDAFQAWYDSDGSSFWLHGIPGCGKSVLSSAVIEHVRHRSSTRGQDVAVAYYHFDFSDEVISSPDLMLRSLISQLSSWNGEPPEALEECAVHHFKRSRYTRSDSLGESHRDGMAQPSSSDLINILRGISEELGDTILVIDALDECIDQDLLLEHLDAMLSWNAKGLRIFMSSRNTPAISSILESKAVHTAGAESNNVGEDIQIFVQEQLKSHPKLRKWPPSLRNEIHDTLTAGAQGMFRWVDCQLTILGKCITTRDVKKALKALPKTLSETYTIALRSIDETHWDYAVRILMFLAISPKPITIGEAVDILAVDFETEVPVFDEVLRMPDESDILAMCATLTRAATIRQLGVDSEIVEMTELRLAHYTVKEYLLSEIFKSNFLHMCPFKDEKGVYSYMAEVSLAYLLGLQDHLSTELLEDRPFSRHAAELWLYYYERSQSDSFSTKLALELFQDDGETIPYSNCCKLFDPIRPWRQPDIHRKELLSPPYYACSRGIEPMVLELLRAGADPNEEKRVYGTCLQTAASSGYVGIVKALLQAGANPNDGVDDYDEGLFCNSIVAASAAGQVEIVALLLQHGANPNYSSWFPTRGSALTEASRRNHIGVVELLMKAGANPNHYHSKPRDVNPLEAAASRGYKECLALMLPHASERTALRGLYKADFLERRDIIEVFIPFVPDGVMSVAADLGYEDLVVDLLSKGAKSESMHFGGRRSNTMSALSRACRAGHLQIARRLIDNGADLNASSYDSDGSYPLANAVFEGHKEIFDLLLQHGVDVNTSGVSGPALQIACFKGHKEMAEALIKHGASLTCGDGRYGGPVQAAVLGDHMDILELVVAAGADINMKAGEVRVWAPDNVDLSASAIAAATKSLNMVMLNWLLDHGADVNRVHDGDGARRDDGIPLTIAAGAGRADMVRKLLEAGALVNLEGMSSFTSSAIFEATKGAHIEVMKRLLDAGADPNSTGGYYRITALVQACMGKSEAAVECLLEAGADIHVRNPSRDQDEPVLVTAAREGTVGIVRVLMKHGADVNEQAKDGWTALHAAARRGALDIIQALLFEFSADPSVPLVNGSIPIHTAASWGYAGCIELLVQGGSDVNARSKNGRTPLHWAAAAEDQAEKAIEWLLEHGADDMLEEYGTNMTARDFVELKAQRGSDEVKTLELFDAKARRQPKLDDLPGEGTTRE